MTEKGGALHTLTMIGGLALMIGAGVLAVAIGLTWQADDTRALIVAGAAVCGGALAILAAIVGAAFGLALFRRMTDRIPPPMTYDRTVAPFREPMPPALPAPQDGQWRSIGAGAYDPWEADPEPTAAAWEDGRR